MPQPIDVPQMQTLQAIGKHPNITEQRLIGLLRRRVQTDLSYLIKTGLISEQQSKVQHYQIPFRPTAVETEYRVTALGQRVIQEAWRSK